MRYQTDRLWSDQFIPAIKRIVGPLLVGETPFEVDTREACDLIVLKARDMRIAARVRRAGFADRYPYEFTLRAKRDNGVATELEKITNGWGDWLFYGHAAHHGGEISRWLVIDLAAWRAHMIRHRKVIAHGLKSNGDGTHFAWFAVRTFPADPPILVAASNRIPRMAGVA